MNLSQNPFQRMFLRWSATSGAQALLTAGLLTGLIGVLGVFLRDDATVVSTALMVVTAGTGFTATALAGAAWWAVIMDDLDMSKRRTRLGTGWFLTSLTALIAAGLLR
jgi:hypothetical protein